MYLVKCDSCQEYKGVVEVPLYGNLIPEDEVVRLCVQCYTFVDKLYKMGFRGMQLQHAKPFQCQVPDLTAV